MLLLPCEAQYADPSVLRANIERSLTGAGVSGTDAGRWSYEAGAMVSSWKRSSSSERTQLRNSVTSPLRTERATQTRVTRPPACRGTA